MKYSRYLFYLSLFLLASCSGEEMNDPDENGGGTVDDSAVATTISIERERPGNTDEILLPQWKQGQTIQVGEYQSKPLTKINGTKAEFEFSEKFSRPFNVLMPVESYAHGTKVKIGAENPVVPYAAHVAKGQAVWLKPLLGGVRLQMKGGYVDGDAEYTLSKVEIRGARGEQMSGVFDLDYRNLVLSRTENTEQSKVITNSFTLKLSSISEEEIELLLPAGEYESGLVLKFIATDGSYYEYTTSTGFVVTGGCYTQLPELIWFRPGEVQQRITGVVKDTSGNPIANVVVSDGRSSVKTDRDGKYALPLSLNEWQPTFVYVSTPSTHNPPVVGGVPKFYKSWAECQTLKSVDFELIPVESNPDRFTLYMIGDPQIRTRGAKSDRIAYYSIDILKDMFLELKEHSEAIKGRKVYGMVLGDVTSGWFDEVPTHIEQCKTLTNVHMYTIIGNHDEVQAAPTAAECHAHFESFFGPRNYSVNIGKYHLIGIDDIVYGSPDVTVSGVGLADPELEWLKGDLAHVPEGTPIIICAHSNLIMTDAYTQVTNGAINGKAYAELLKKYAQKSKVYSFAGHSHTMFNYVYPDDHEFRNFEVHTMPRATGILNLNEYISDGGTPRGFLVCEVDGDNIRWKYHFTKYENYENLSNAAPNTPPSYNLRLWEYKNGIAYIGDKMLDDSFQIRAYDGGVYPDGCVYANIFMYDEKWSDVYLHVDGGGKYKMERVPKGDPYTYDAANEEIINHYQKYHEYFEAYGHRVTDTVRHLFRIKPNEAHGSGRVEVTDRFGEKFTATVKW